MDLDWQEDNGNVTLADDPNCRGRKQIETMALDYYDFLCQKFGEENAFIFGLSSDEVINFEHNGGYNPNDIFNNDAEIRKVLIQLVNGTFDRDTELFRPIYDSLLTNNYGPADKYFILADFRS